MRRLAGLATVGIVLSATAGAARACDACLGGVTLHPLPVPQAVATVAPSGGYGTSLLSPPAAPTLSSRPGAFSKLYLDFDGDFSVGWGPYTPNTTPAYSVDNDPGTFSTLELDYIHRIWSAVAEAYSPFDVDVTTVEPGIFNPKYFRVVIGGNGSWYPVVAGGLAYVGAFQVNFLPKTGWVFSSNLLPDDPQHPLFVAAAATHEAGHAFGMEHQSSWGPNGELLDRYNRGDAVKAPFMGSSYRKRGLWWNGPNELGPGTIQDDLSILAGSANGFGYRPDDHGGSPATSTPLAQNGFELFGSGVIERASDQDFFAFSVASADAVYFSLAPAPYGAMLDGSLALYDGGGTLLQLVDTPSLGEALTASLSAGAYYVAVLSHGGYGDIGQYSITGSIGVPIPEPAGAGVLTVVILTALRGRNWRRDAGLAG